MDCQICKQAEATTTVTITSKKTNQNVVYNVCAKCANIMKQN